VRQLTKAGCKKVFREIVSRITAIDGVVVTLFDGLPASASRRAVGIVGSGSGSSGAPSLSKRCIGRSGPSRSSARRALHARRKEAAARGSARLRASLDRRCDQRSVRLQAGTEKRRSNRTEKHEGRDGGMVAVVENHDIATV
jgi:hypothetical protein